MAPGALRRAGYGSARCGPASQHGSQGEDFLGAVARPRVRYRIIVRGAPVGAARRPRPDQRLRDGTRIFDILTVTEADPAGRYLDILAEEGLTA